MASLSKSHESTEIVGHNPLSPYNADKYRKTFSAVRKILPWIQDRDFHLNIAHTSFSYMAIGLTHHR